MNGAIKLWAITLGAMGLGLWAAQYMGSGSKDATNKVLAQVDIVLTSPDPIGADGDVFVTFPVNGIQASVPLRVLAGSYWSTARIVVRPGSIPMGQLTE